MTKSPLPVKQRASESFWQDHVSVWRKSNLSQAEYCRRHGLIKTQFGYWKNKLIRGQERSVSLFEVPVNISPLNPVSYSRALVLIINSHIKLEVSGDFDPLILSKLVRTLLDLR